MIGSDSSDQEDGIIIQHRGITDYVSEWEAMKAYTNQRGDDAPDLCWLTQHSSVYTLGLNIKPENRPFLASSWYGGEIPCVETDRGGQVTYHGLGQFIVYFMVDLRRRRLAVKEMVAALERGTLNFLTHLKINAHLNTGAPGVYVDGAKIASLGLKIRRGCTYHGLSLNADMDLTPFQFIHPCGYQGLRVTQLNDLGIDCSNSMVLHEQLARYVLDEIMAASKVTVKLKMSE